MECDVVFIKRRIAKLLNKMQIAGTIARKLDREGKYFTEIVVRSTPLKVERFLTTFKKIAFDYLGVRDLSCAVRIVNNLDRDFTKLKILDTGTDINNI